MQKPAIPWYCDSKKSTLEAISATQKYKFIHFGLMHVDTPPMNQKKLFYEIFAKTSSRITQQRHLYGGYINILFKFLNFLWNIQNSNKI